MLAADGTDQAAGVLIAAQIDELEIVQQAGLQLDQLNPSPQRFEDRQAVGLKPRQGQLLQQVVEVGDEAIAEAMAVLAGQAMENGDEPTDQLQGAS